MSDDMKDIFGEDSDDERRPEEAQSYQQDEESNESNQQKSSDEDEKNASGVVADVFGEELNDLSGESESEKDEVSFTQKQYHTTIEEHENEEDTQTEQILQSEMSKIKTHLKGNEVHFVKLPNFLSVEPKPFDPEYYEDETANSEALDEEGKTRVKLKVENTMRWRWIKCRDGTLKKQTNARIMKWSDGSLSMHLGNEIFDVSKPPIQGDHNHLFVREGTSLQGQAVFRTKLTFRPHSTDSLTHRKMTMSLVDRGSKTQKVKILTDIVKNPEQARSELLKKEEERQKAQSRRENQQRRMREKSHAKHISSAYLEDKYDASDDENAISLSAIKSKYKNKSENQRQSIYSSGDESDRERRLNKAKNLDYESDDGDKNTSRRKKKVVSDDDD